MTEKIDVIYDDTEIVHVLEAENEGIRGVSINHNLIRCTITEALEFFENKQFNTQKIDEYVTENQNLA